MSAFQRERRKTDLKPLQGGSNGFRKAKTSKRYGANNEGTRSDITSHEWSD
jgi:hypothetical protein